MKEFIKRLRAKTPKFFVQLQKFLLTFSFVAGLGLAEIEKLPKWFWLEEFLRTGIFCGLFGTFIAQLTRESGSIEKTEEKTTTNPNDQQSNTL